MEICIIVALVWILVISFIICARLNKHEDNEFRRSNTNFDGFKNLKHQIDRYVDKNDRLFEELIKARQMNEILRERLEGPIYDTKYVEYNGDTYQILSWSLEQECDACKTVTIVARCVKEKGEQYD